MKNVYKYIGTYICSMYIKQEYRLFSVGEGRLKHPSGIALNCLREDTGSEPYKLQ